MQRALNEFEKQLSDYTGLFEKYMKTKQQDEAYQKDLEKEWLIK